MTVAEDNGSQAAQGLSERVFSSLRHEVGDLLQTIYSAVALLRARLPSEMEMERRILGDLRTRAESCKELLETLHDLTAPLQLTCELVDLGELVELQVARLSARSPNHPVRFERTPVPALSADARRLAQVVHLLLTHACAAASGPVLLHLSPAAGEGGVVLTVLGDGPTGVPEENAVGTAPPAEATALLSPGLLLVQRLVLLHAGRLAVGKTPEGGVRVSVFLPVGPPQRL